MLAARRVFQSAVSTSFRSGGSVRTFHVSTRLEKRKGTGKGFKGSPMFKATNFKTKGDFEKEVIEDSVNLRGLDETKHDLLLGIKDLPKEEGGMKENIVGEMYDDIARAVSMQTANGKEITAALKRDIIKKYQRFPGDTGSSEVQVAIMTVKLNNLKRHLEKNKKDHVQWRQHNLLYHKRRRMMQYLKGHRFDKYVQMLEDCDMTEKDVWEFGHQPHEAYRYPRKHIVSAPDQRA